MYFSCPDGQVVEVTVDGASVPGCMVGSGAWIAEPVPFWQQTIPPEQVGELFGAEILLFAIVWVGRKVEENI